MVVLGGLAGCFLFQKLSWASRERDWISQADGAITRVFSPQPQASKPVITLHQHPFFGSWHGLPKATFCPRLKFPFGGCGTRNQSRPLAELLNVGWEDQPVRMSPSGTGQRVHVCVPGTHDEFLSFLIVMGVKNSCTCFLRSSEPDFLGCKLF